MTTAERPVRVLFLCTHNSARSQMAEALLRRLGGEHFAASSAGSEVTQVHPLAVEAMAEIGVDISGQRSKHLNEFIGTDIDYVVTVCDRANANCPFFPGAPRRIHWSFDDPSAATGTEAERLAAFRRVRDQIAERIGVWIEQSP